MPSARVCQLNWGRLVISCTQPITSTIQQRVLCLMLAGGDYKACTSCGPYQTSPPESPSRDFCECRAGYGTIGAGRECELCPLGTFWGGPKSPSQHLTTLMAQPARRVSPCISCSEAFPAGLFTTAARGSTSQSQCVCLAGKGTGLIPEIDPWQCGIAVCVKQQCVYGLYAGLVPYQWVLHNLRIEEL